MIPELMNCAHDPEGWCLDCLKTMISRDEVAAAMEELQGNLIADAQAEATWGSGTNENTIKRHFKLIITKLGLAPGAEREVAAAKTLPIEQLCQPAREQMCADLAGAMGATNFREITLYSLAGLRKKLICDPPPGKEPNLRILYCGVTKTPAFSTYEPPDPFTSADDSRALVAWLRSQSETQAKMHGRFCRNLLAALDLEIEGEYYWRIVDELLNAPLPAIAEAAWRAIQQAK